MEEFLQRIDPLYEIIIFTASESNYANEIIDLIDKKKIIKHRFFRENCTFINGVYCKELKKLNRDIKSIIIIDNNPDAFIFDKENGIPLKGYYGNKEDKELIQLAYILEKISKYDDVRPLIKQIVDDNIIDYDKAYELFRDKNKNNIEEIQIDLKKEEEIINIKSNRNRKRKVPMSAKISLNQSKNLNSNGIVPSMSLNSVDFVSNKNFNDYKTLGQINSTRTLNPGIKIPNLNSVKNKGSPLLKYLNIEKINTLAQSVALDIQNDLSSNKNNYKGINVNLINCKLNLTKRKKLTKAVNNSNPGLIKNEKKVPLNNKKNNMTLKKDEPKIRVISKDFNKKMIIKKVNKRTDSLPPKSKPKNKNTVNKYLINSNRKENTKLNNVKVSPIQKRRNKDFLNLTGSSSLKQLNKDSTLSFRKGTPKLKNTYSEKKFYEQMDFSDFNINSEDKDSEQKRIKYTPNTHKVYKCEILLPYEHKLYEEDNLTPHCLFKTNRNRPNSLSKSKNNITMACHKNKRNLGESFNFPSYSSSKFSSKRTAKSTKKNA
ncbi:MAG: HAD family hydrolase [archaeon]|nr:HAD family hydrolase [archaeon]